MAIGCFCPCLPPPRYGVTRFSEIFLLFQLRGSRDFPKKIRPAVSKILKNLDFSRKISKILENFRKSLENPLLEQQEYLKKSWNPISWRGEAGPETTNCHMRQYCTEKAREYVLEMMCDCLSYLLPSLLTYMPTCLPIYLLTYLLTCSLT